MTLYLILTAVVVFILIIINLIPAKKPKKPKSVLDALMENPEFQKLKTIQDYMIKESENGTDQDVMPEGVGKFGLEATNPIPINSIFGSKIYLNNLKTSEGKPVQYIRLGSTHASNIQKPIDIYEITVEKEVIAKIFISPYNKKNSDKTPEGFKIGE